MTNDLISREAVIAYIKSKIRARDGQTVICNDIEAIPAIDAVEVVRCGECGISCESRIGDNWIYCQNNELHHKKQHFCSYGKRRESEVSE